MRTNEQLTNSIVGLNVATAMASRSIDVEALAGSIGVQPDHLRACIRGEDRLPVDQVCDAAQRLGVPVIDLFTLEDASDYVIH